jgi:hypothetical protein
LGVHASTVGGISAERFRGRLRLVEVLLVVKREGIVAAKAITHLDLSVLVATATVPSIARSGPSPARRASCSPASVFNRDISQLLLDAAPSYCGNVTSENSYSAASVMEAFFEALGVVGASVGAGALLELEPTEGDRPP